MYLNFDGYGNMRCNNLRVLFIDDEPALLDQAKIFLEKEDERIEVDTTNSAERGLEMINDESYAAVVSDYRLTGMDGIELLQTLREESNDIPFIVFTGWGSKEIERNALDLGADKVIRKGKSPKSLYKELARILLELSE